MKIWNNKNVGLNKNENDMKFKGIAKYDSPENEILIPFTKITN